jgi:hypothetical protein
MYSIVQVQLLANSPLVVWINELRGEGVPISAMMLHLHTLEVAVKSGYKRAGLVVEEVEVVASEMIAELASLSLVDGRIGTVAEEHDTIESSSLCDELLD